MKIYLYWLMRNETPYYVGVTRRKFARYQLSKRKDMVIIEEFDNRIDARNSERYWIHQLKTWGFVLENKSDEPFLIKHANKNSKFWRLELSQEASEKLELAELKTGANRNIIASILIEKFAEQLKKQKPIDLNKELVKWKYL